METFSQSGSRSRGPTVCSARDAHRKRARAARPTLCLLFCLALLLVFCRKGTHPLPSHVLFVGSSHMAAAGQQDRILTRLLDARGHQVNVQGYYGRGMGIIRHWHFNQGEPDPLSLKLGEGDSPRVADPDPLDPVAEAVGPSPQPRWVQLKGKLEGRLQEAPWDVTIFDSYGTLDWRTLQPFDDTEKVLGALAELVRRAHPSTRLVLQGDWVVQNRPQLQVKHDEILEQAARSTGWEYAPIGRILTDLHVRHPEIKLFRTDKDSHPALAGAYLAACVHFTLLTGESPVGLPWRFAIAPSYDFFKASKSEFEEFALLDQDARTIQDAVWEDLRKLKR